MLPSPSPAALLAACMNRSNCVFGDPLPPPLPLPPAPEEEEEEEGAALLSLDLTESFSSRQKASSPSSTFSSGSYTFHRWNAKASIFTACVLMHHTHASTPVRTLDSTNWSIASRSASIVDDADCVTSFSCCLRYWISLSIMFFSWNDRCSLRHSFSTRDSSDMPGEPADSMALSTAANGRTVADMDDDDDDDDPGGGATSSVPEGIRAGETTTSFVAVMRAPPPLAYGKYGYGYSLVC